MLAQLAAKPALHGKVIAVDDAAFYVGSQNAYPNQLQEFGYIIEDPAAMADFKRDYLDPMVQYSSRAALSCDGAPTVPSAWRTGVLDRITPGSDVAVSLGDSFISGEAGRWNGNVGKKGNFGLIDAGANAYWDTATGESEAKCHRSKSAEIHIDGITGVNIACSGAITTSKSNLVGDWKPGIDRGVNGTDKYGQLTLLDAVAKRAEVKAAAPAAASASVHRLLLLGLTARSLLALLSVPLLLLVATILCSHRRGMSHEHSRSIACMSQVQVSTTVPCKDHPKSVTNSGPISRP